MAQRDQACPMRGPGLSHVQDTDKDPSGRCVHCSAPLDWPMPRWGYATGANEPTEAGYDRARGPQGDPGGPGRGELTIRQVDRLKFLAWLREHRGID